MSEAIACTECGRRIDDDGHICPAKFYEWTVKIRVNATWVADGFDLTGDRLHAMVAHDLGYAHFSEIQTEIVTAPDADEVAREMGYKGVEDRRRRKGGLVEPCDECSGTRWPTKHHDAHCSLHEAK